MEAVESWRYWKRGRGVGVKGRWKEVEGVERTKRSGVEGLRRNGGEVEEWKREKTVGGNVEMRRRGWRCGKAAMELWKSIEEERMSGEDVEVTKRVQKGRWTDEEGVEGWRGEG